MNIATKNHLNKIFGEFLFGSLLSVARKTKKLS